MTFLFISAVTDLQGYVELFTVSAVPDIMITVTKEYGPGNTTALLTDLKPNTQYSVTVMIRINGGASISSDPVAARTIDGGMKYII